MDKDLNPKISVLMPAYNAAPFIKSAIKSVLDQTYKDFELLVLNDCSADDTEVVAKSFKDERIRIFRNEKNSGIVFTRNRLIALARGKYIAWLDADDIARPERLRKQNKFLDEHLDFALVGTWTDLIDESGNPTGVRWKNRFEPEDIKAALFFGNRFVQSSVMIRKKYLPEPAFHPEYEPAEDWDLYIRLSDRKKLGTMPELLTEYRTVKTSASHAGEAKEQARRKIITENLNRLGISPTEEEYELQSAAFAAKRSEPDLLMKKERWLSKLAGKNDELGIFEKTSFRKVAAAHWLFFCRANSNGLPTWSTFWRSPLSRSLPKYQWRRELLKFLLECFMK